jgi:Spy/CpxP family protein refolding chaperone
MKKALFVSIAAAAMILFGAIFAQAQQGRGRMQDSDDKPGFGMKARMAEELDLTADQIKQIRDMRVETKRKLIPLHSEMELAQLDLHESIRSGADQATVDKKIDALSAIRTKMQKLRVQQRLQFHNMLTDEQKEKLEALPMGGFGFGDGDGPRGMGGHGMRGPGGGCGMLGSGSPMQGDASGPHFGDCPWIDDDGI